MWGGAGTSTSGPVSGSRPAAPPRQGGGWPRRCRCWGGRCEGGAGGAERRCWGAGGRRWGAGAVGAALHRAAIPSVSAGSGAEHVGEEAAGGPGAPGRRRRVRGVSGWRCQVGRERRAGEAERRGPVGRAACQQAAPGSAVLCHREPRGDTAVPASGRRPRVLVARRGPGQAGEAGQPGGAVSSCGSAEGGAESGAPPCPGGRGRWGWELRSGNPCGKGTARAVSALNIVLAGTGVCWFAFRRCKVYWGRGATGIRASAKQPVAAADLEKTLVWFYIPSSGRSLELRVVISDMWHGWNVWRCFSVQCSSEVISQWPYGSSGCRVLQYLYHHCLHVAERRPKIEKMSPLLSFPYVS